MLSIQKSLKWRYVLSWMTSYRTIQLQEKEANYKGPWMNYKHSFHMLPMFSEENDKWLQMEKLNVDHIAT